MSLHELVKPKHGFDELHFPPEVSSIIDEVLEDHKYQAELNEHGMKVRRRILIHGPSGCGKTSVAHAIAKHLGMPLYEVSAANVIEATLGSSEKNTERIMKFAQDNRVVLLIDEFDSLGCKRIKGDSAADSSNNRQLNTLLTNMEKREPLGMIIGCTNLFENIDTALHRRFDLILEIPSPNRDSLKKIADGILKGRFNISSDDVLAEASTPAMIVKVAQNKLRRAIIENAKRSREVSLQQSFSQLEDLKGKLSEKRPRKTTAEAVSS